MAFPLFRIRSRAAETSSKKFVLVTHAKLMSDSSSRFHEQFRFILLRYAFAIEMIEVRLILFCQFSYFNIVSEHFYI